MAKKEIKRKNLKLRRRLRKTLGAVCLITALLIALIPVPETKAAGDKNISGMSRYGRAAPHRAAV